MEDMLDYLFSLTVKEFEENELTEHENKGYIAIVEYCYNNDILIDFGIRM